MPDDQDHAVENEAVTEDLFALGLSRSAVASGRNHLPNLILGFAVARMHALGRSRAQIREAIDLAVMNQIAGHGESAVERQLYRALAHAVSEYHLCCGPTPDLHALLWRVAILTLDAIGAMGISSATCPTPGD